MQKEKTLYYQHSDNAVPYIKNLLKRARENRKSANPVENKLWFECLRNRQFQGLKFTRQKPLLSYIVDFYCASLGLVIELDGDSHSLQKGYDEKRTKDLENYGLTIVRYMNNEVMNNLEGVYCNLLDVVNRLKKKKKFNSLDNPLNPPNPPLERGE